MVLAIQLDTEANFFQDFHGLKITYIAHEHELSYALEKLDTGRYQIGVWFVILNELFLMAEQSIKES